MKIKSLGMIQHNKTNVVEVVDGSFVELNDCEVVPLSETSPICLSGSCGLFTNISLRFSSTTFLQTFPSLFSSKPVEGVHSEKCFVSVCSSHFSSFSNDACSPQSATSIQTTCLMNSCSFSSVCDAYNGGIIPSLNNPYASLTASNTSFIGCCRARNVECIGTETNKLTPGRQNETFDGVNSFTWCEWDGSKANGSKDDYADGSSNGGAIRMYNLNSGELTVSHCSLNDCYAHYAGGGVMCFGISSVEIEHSFFNSCKGQNRFGGGMFVNTISSCVRVSGCEFQNCTANSRGGGLFLENFQVSGTGCVEAENGEGGSACVFDCSFTSCSVTNYFGGGVRCYNVPYQFKMRNIKFISCTAVSSGGGLYLEPFKEIVPNEEFYCYFLFFHNCSCKITSNPYGHDIEYVDYYNVHLDSGNPFYECCTTNTDNKRMCYSYNYANASAWTYQHTEKRNWLKRGILNRFVAVSGGGEDDLCGLDETSACRTIGVAVIRSMLQVSLSVTLMEGNHQSESSTIDIGSKKITVIGKGRGLSSIGTGALSSTRELFSVSTGHLGMSHLKVDCNSNAGPSPSVVVVSDGGGSLSLEDVVITTSKTGEYVMSSSVFVVPLSQLSIIDVEIKDMNVSKPLFSEPDLSSSSSFSSALFMTSKASGDKELANVTVTDVKLTSGDGVVMAKSVKEGEIFVVQNVTIEDCECEDGNGGGMNVHLAGDGEVVVSGTSSIDGCKAEKNGGNEGRGGGIFVGTESGECGLTIRDNVEFSKVKKNVASYGKDVFVSCGIGVLLESKVNTDTFTFIDTSTIPSDVLRLSGSENGDENGVIPLFVYLCTMGTKVLVDGSGGNGKDHNRCGFEEFGCLTVDYCVNLRMSENVNEIEIVSSSSIKDEIEISSIGVIISGRTTSSEEEEEMMQVDVSDEGSATQEWLVGCSSSLTMRRLSFVVKGQLNSRSAFIHSTSTLSVTNCSVSFESGALTSGKIGYSIIEMAGGNLVVDGFVMESGVTLTVNGKSPITMTSGVQLEILNSRVSGVEVEVAGGNGGGGCLNVGMGVNGNVKIEESNISSTCSGGNGMKGGGMMISVGSGGTLRVKGVKYSGCEVPTEDREEGGRGMGGGMFVKLPDQMGTFVMEGMAFEGCDGWKGKNMFASGRDLREIVKKEHLKWEMSSQELGSLDELCGWERKTTGEEGYVIPLVVYLWRNWSGNGFVSREKGGDFSGCGYSEAPCSSIDYLISLRYEPLREGKTHIRIVRSGLLSHSTSFSSLLPPVSQNSELPQVVIEGTKKGTSVTICDEDENYLNDSMISSNMSLLFINVSFTKPTITTHHEVFIESFGTNTVLSITDCSFGSSSGMEERFEYCILKVNGGSAAIQSCTLNNINELKGLIAFSPSAAEVTVQNVNILFASVIERSLISMIDDKNQMKGKENTHSNANCSRPVLRVVGCLFSNITNEGNGASVIEVGSFENGVECVIDECSMSSCKSGLSREGGGLKVVLNGEESVLKVNGSSFSICKCSTVSGRGGGLFIDGSDLQTNYGNESQIPSLNFKIANILFYLNEAHVGKDIFVRCHSIERQINETLFALNYNQESLNSNNSICGRDASSEGDVDLIPLITFYYSAQVFVSGRGSDGRGCGSQSNPCKSINWGVDHIQEGVMNAILIDDEGIVSGQCVIRDLNVNSFKKAQAIVKLKSEIVKSGEKSCIMELINECSLERCSFQFEDGFESIHNCLMKVKNGSTEIQKCEFFSSTTTVEMKLNSSIVSAESGELKISETIFRDIRSTRSILSFHEVSEVTIDEARILNIECEGDVVSAEGKAKVVMKEMEVENVTLLLNGCAIAIEDAEQEVSMLNSSFGKWVNSMDNGRMIQIKNSKDVRIEACVFDGEKEIELINEENDRKEGLCKWNGSLVDVEKSKIEMKETMIAKSKVGGLWVSGGSVKIEKGEFENNNPSIDGYPSARRNVICEGDGELNVVSVKGGDGWERNTSLWILNEGCSFEGIVSERDSSFFIPVLESVEVKEEANRMKLIFKGMLLIPCNLSFSIVKRKGEEKEIEKYDFDSNGFISETQVEGSVAKDLISSCGDEIEVSVHILFGNTESSSSTQSFILKNTSEAKMNGDEKLVESGKGYGSSSTVIIIVLVIILLIVLIVAIVLAVRWKKVKNEAKDLREIVNDTARKDPKAFEMVTMDMSPEEQWRRAEREAEKKNEERIKKRVHETNMEHSESSEHLLSESGSTEYILGRDSDKIPQWMLEKVEEEEIRKRTPSPSTSSSLTTDTSDADTTFVRSESMCPTTSSMSNLVDAMACSSPHEKLIVDLRDSLFMLLHGRNEKKEMAIGTLQEREMTAAQILFWVANLALHSFDEMENPLSSLANLSPHIVLFSEHMVICIVMHSDFSSSDSDSSSISSTTVVTSASDDDDDDSLPSSAFEDEDDFRKECLRWKAPELLVNKKMGATKESVSFSIGMMVWECLTLEIPFVEYPAEVAGDKICTKERPDVERARFSQLFDVICLCLSQDPSSRPMLSLLKREFIRHFPAGATTLTVSDAIDLENDEEETDKEDTSFTNIESRLLMMKLSKKMTKEKE
ncbi:uncharacterized protein MONOS_8411 [Monocercomonoides exilis]|uniref:uncharacterized protein n=1 Tax=Monocercomonoides exilis TaxID=2049356 RepID=UPI00355991D4|nr:hypothetical protein MONOS_8411 [Monocercomonoides exilis]|eukprot:MONOS_8411.1-p1 / transcript=MONOS_8411.1 / gene=MONOS_8411 / organism=Monocercomonoides_exilis_PA203 / gene_product=unspecified product / transcript_product=unspecified product / location=Mono_scaffold00316:14793-22580(+) / protein_length=2567 / sequence_SO=supercontig / SO=protein_coding / is_pseudo=false